MCNVSRKMKLKLYDGQRISLSNGSEEIIETPNGAVPVYRRYSKIRTCLTTIQNCDSSDSTKCSRLHELLVKYATDKIQPAGSFPDIQVWELDIFVGISTHELANENATLQGYIQLQGIFHGNCLEGLRDLSKGQATLQVQLYSLQDNTRHGQCYSRQYYVSPPSLTNLAHTDDVVIDSGKRATCTGFDITFPKSNFHHWTSNAMELSCTITVTIPEDTLTGNYTPMASGSDTTIIARNRKILEDELFSNVTIIPANGAVIKAHKVFLASQSSVFSAMFNVDMKESRESVVNVPDMCEEGVRELLKFLYYEDISIAGENSRMALLLFYAAHKYHIQSLQDLMRGILLNKSLGWYDMDVAVNLFMFARNLIPVDEDLKLKAARVLKPFAKNLERSSAYHELFRKDIGAAMELCRYAFEV